MNQPSAQDPVQIRIEGLYKIFGPNPAKALHLLRSGMSKDAILRQTGNTVGLRDINLEIKRGEIFVIMGLSGSGKSTLIRHFNRLIDPTAGRVIIEGTDVTSLSRLALRHFRRHSLSMVFQRFGLFPHKSVIDNVAFGLTVQGVKRTERLARARQWLEDVGLSGYENQYPSQLSGGQQQRVGLARALCTDAGILLMDEAFSALDPLIRSEMQDQLVELQERLRKTIIFITHDLDEALRIGARIAILRDGALIQVGEPKDILLTPADSYVEAFVRDVNRARALSVETVMKPARHRITASTVNEALAQMRGQSGDWAYRVGANGAYAGLLTREALETAASAGQGAAPLDSVAEALPGIASSLPIEAVLTKSLATPIALPVVDEDGELLGQLSRNDVSAVLDHKDGA